MKLSLLILYIVSLASSKIIDSHNHTMINSTYNNQTTIEANYYNKTTEKPTANSFITNSKQCYKCNFNIDDFMNIKTLFHNYCANKTLSCDNTFCSIMLSRNKHDDKHMLELGCVSENYCLDFAEQKTGRSKAISNNYSNCCNSNLCNDEKAVERLLPIQSLLFEPEFIINPNNTFYAINDIAPVNQKVIPEAIVSNVLHDFNFEDYNINKDCINEVFFTAKDNLIITLKNNICNNKDISRDDIPFSISQPINKIIFLNVNNQTVYELLSSDKGITSFNYIKDKKLLFFISNDFVFTYKIDDNNQLIKIKQFYLEHKPVDISINYNGTVIAIANKYTVFFYNIEQIEQTQEFKPIEAVIGGFNIYRIQYVPNKDILLVETQNFNNLKTNVYNVENFNKIEFIGGTPIFNRQKKPKSMDCLVYYYWVHNTNIYNREYKKININERSYYGKWIISSSGDFIMNHRVIFACPTSRGINFPRKELYYGYRWNKKINKYSYSINYDIATNLDMFNNRIKTRWVEHYYSWLGRRSNKLYFLTDIVAVYEYFFSNNENIVLALIAKEDENNKNNRYLHLKDISYKDIDEPFGEVLRNQKRILRYKLFDLAHSGVFNHDSSKLAIFSDNRIQVYLMNLSKHFSSAKNTASMSFTVTPSPAVMTEETSIITSSPAVMINKTDEQ